MARFARLAPPPTAHRLGAAGAHHEPPLAAFPGDYCPPGLLDRMRQALERGDREGAAVAFAETIFGLTDADIVRRRRLDLWPAMVEQAPVILRELENVARYAMGASRFAACASPTLLLVGERSPTEYHATARALLECLPNARRRLIPGQAHGAIDAAPELFVAAVVEFAEELAAAQAGSQAG